MLVGSRMTYPVITVGPRTEISAALDILNKEHVFSMPVIDRQGRLLGMVDASQLESSCSGQKEENPQFVEDVMSRKVLFVTKSTPVEEAARMLIDYNVRALPVMHDNFLVGIITATSLNRILMELTGARQSGVRLTVSLDDKTAGLYRLMDMIKGLNGKINSISSYCSENCDGMSVTLKIDDVDKFKLKQAVSQANLEMVDIR